MVALEAAVHRADNRHRANAIDKGSGHKALGKAAASAELAVGELSQLVEALFNVDGAPDQAANDDGKNHAHRVGGLERAAHSNKNHAQPEPLHHCATKPFRDTPANKKSYGGAQAKWLRR